jgi:hypothetical protein
MNDELLKKDINDYFTTNNLDFINVSNVHDVCRLFKGFHCYENQIIHIIFSKEMQELDEIKLDEIELSNKFSIKNKDLKKRKDYIQTIKYENSLIEILKNEQDILNNDSKLWSMFFRKRKKFTNKILRLLFNKKKVEFIQKLYFRYMFCDNINDLPKIDSLCDCICVRFNEYIKYPNIFSQSLNVVIEHQNTKSCEIINKQIISNPNIDIIYDDNKLYNPSSESFHELKATHIIFHDRFDDFINKGFFSDIVKSIVFGIRYNRYIDKDVLPPYLESLTFGRNFNQQIDKKILSDTIKYLEFGHCFTRKILKGSLPSHLIELVFGDCYDQEFEEGTFPDTLQFLTLGYSYNKPINEKYLPPHLKYIVVGNCFSHPLDHLPKDIKIVKRLNKINNLKFNKKK